MEKAFRSAPKHFWKTVRHLRRRKPGTIQALYSNDGTLLTSTEKVIGRWKEHFEELLNPTNPPSTVEAELEDDVGSSLISLGEVTEVVKQLYSGKAPEVDEIRPEMLKALGVMGLSWLTHLMKIAWKSGAVPKEWQTRVVVPLFKKGDQRVCANYWGITLRCLPGKVYSKVLESQNQCQNQKRRQRSFQTIRDFIPQLQNKVERFCAQNSEDLAFQYHFIYSQFAQNLFQKRSFRRAAPQWFLVI